MISPWRRLKRQTPFPMISPWRHLFLLPTHINLLKETVDILAGRYEFSELLRIPERHVLVKQLPVRVDDHCWYNVEEVVSALWLSNSKTFNSQPLIVSLNWASVINVTVSSLTSLRKVVSDVFAKGVSMFSINPVALHVCISFRVDRLDEAQGGRCRSSCSSTSLLWHCAVGGCHRTDSTFAIGFYSCSWSVSAATLSWTLARWS